MQLSVPFIVGGVLALVVFTAAIFFAALATFVRRWRAEAQADLDRYLEGRPTVLVADGANLFGVESIGVAQMRGNGILAATDDEVVFVMWKPRKIVRIARDRIDAVETPRSHLGKTTLVKLLKLVYRNEGGDRDSAAWSLRELDPWVELLGGVTSEKASAAKEEHA